MANLGQLRQATRQEIRIDRLWKIWNDDTINDAVNDAIKEVNKYFNFRWQFSIKEATLNTVANTREYTLPTDFVRLDLIRALGVVLDSTTLLELKSDYQTFIPGVPQTYYINQNMLGLHPVPTEVIAIDYNYRSKEADLMADTDQTGLPNDFKRAISIYASYICLTQFGDAQNLQRANTKKQRFSEEMGRLVQLFGVQDAEQLLYKPANRSFRRPRVVRG